ncbi:hypothetical protein [Brachyspira innocens]|uniref:hypothetical protein n=1 Tax=Brachyspira innocens TaxID=13264 RepID=UPI0026F1CDFC|nr:hypothetical protein [Brachyspira innocens]
MKYEFISLEECIYKIEGNDIFNLSVKAHLLTLQKNDLWEKAGNIALTMHRNTKENEKPDPKMLYEYKELCNKVSDINKKILDIDYQIYNLKYKENE